MKHPSMDKTLKKKWLNALRSGEYAQGKNRLRTRGGKGKDRYCCLGVLADVINPKLWNDPGPKDTWRWNGAQNLLPSKLIADFGVFRQAGLAQMNDEGQSFTKIADWIEENL